MTVVAAADGGHSSNRVVEVASDLASAYDDDLVVLHVIPEELFERRRETNEEYLSNHAIADAKNIVREVVSETVEDYYEVSPAGRVGEPATEIIEVAVEYDASYIVVGSRQRSPVGKAMFGSVTQSVLHHADRPVVTVMEGD